MKTFMDENFMLHNDTAAALYDAVRDLPIIDYHCHLIPQEVADDKHFSNITDLALRGDHYKWRLMRANGVPEKFITGDGTDEEKFHHWCATIEDGIGSPLYHWTHLEMRRYFDYDGPINAEKSAEIYAHCNKIISRDDFSVWNIFKNFKVAQIATTDDPIDSLEHHIKMADARAKDPALPLVQPSFRPSGVLGADMPTFAAYIAKLGEVSGQKISSWDSLLAALESRIDFFHKVGCRVSDHALDPPVFAEGGNPDAILKKALGGETPSAHETAQYQSALMAWLGGQYTKRGWVMQLHMGAQRNNNQRMFKLLGADTGYDSISDATYSKPLAQILNALELENALPKTVIYGLNPGSDAMLATMIGNFQGGGIKGRMQWGSAWWFNDTKIGMRNHMSALAEYGSLARFVGMLTDSRSFMSYPRHEYFRRIMVQLISEWVEAGEFPSDMPKLKHIAEGIAYRNALEYFELPL